MIDCVLSFSGGKDSHLALHRVLAQGWHVRALLTTYDSQAECSCFHAIPKPVLTALSQCLDMPLICIPTHGADYETQFTAELLRQKMKGVTHCVFGDIDIVAHRTWGEARCQEAGLVPVFPLWQMPRAEVVRLLLDLGFCAIVTKINADCLPPSDLGKALTPALLEKWKCLGVDVCGERGEYHSLVVDAPHFRLPLSVSLSAPKQDGSRLYCLPSVEL